MKKVRQIPAGWRLKAIQELRAPKGRGARLGLQVWISHLDAEVERQGLSRERLKAEVEIRLSLAGLPLCDSPPGGWWSGIPCLGVILHVQPDPGAVAWPFSLELFYVENQAAGVGAPGPTLHLHWCREAIGEVLYPGCAADWSPVYDRLAHLLEEFIQDYRTLYPSTASACLVS